MDLKKVASIYRAHQKKFIAGKEPGNEEKTKSMYFPAAYHHQRSIPRLHEGFTTTLTSNSNVPGGLAFGMPPPLWRPQLR